MKIVAWVDVPACGSDRVVGRSTRRAPCGLAQWCQRPARGRDVCVRLVCAAVRDVWRSAMRGWGARLSKLAFTPCPAGWHHHPGTREAARAGLAAVCVRDGIYTIYSVGGGRRAYGGGGHLTFLLMIIF